MSRPLKGIAHFRRDGPGTPRWLAVMLRKAMRQVLPSRMDGLTYWTAASGVAVLDVSEPDDPKLQDAYESDALPIDATVSGTHLYLLNRDSVQVIDTRRLIATSSFREIRFPFELKLVGSALYVADLYQLRIFRVHPEGYSLAVEESMQSDWTPHTVKSASVNRLSQNFPNPFNPETWIPYQLASDTNVRLHIYDSSG